MTPAVFHLVVNGQRRAKYACDAGTYTVQREGAHMMLYPPTPMQVRRFPTVDACQHAMRHIAPLSEWEVVA